MPKKIHYTKELLEPIAQKSKSIAEMLRYLNLIEKGGNFKTIKRNLIKFNIDYSHFTGQGWSKNLTQNDLENIKNGTLKRTKHTLENSFVRDNYLTSKSINRLLKQYGMKYQCKNCGLSDTWNQKSLVLHVDHINGINNDNTITNLRYLCPNCHSQTDTYCSKNGRGDRT